MVSRLDLQTLLETFTPHVYFQPPINTKVEYPCIVYKRDFANTLFADNSPYRHTWRYLVTVIDPDPEGVISEKVAAMPLCTYSRFFAVDHLNHDVFQLFF